VVTLGPAHNPTISAVTSIAGGPDQHHTDAFLASTSPFGGTTTYEYLCPAAPPVTTAQYGAFTAGGKTYLRTRVGTTLREYTKR
jgi:hypothetical protein